ncbi:unnamed protein product [Amoebophrya sp. A25]|nr:unnamed protein product [Amoebophrya sp. A25]|eukprot:GSA25T00002213001.1
MRDYTDYTGSTGTKGSCNTKVTASVEALLAGQRRASWWTEFMEIWKRTLIARLRQRFATRLTIIQNVFIMVLVGIFFFDVGRHPAKIDTRNGAIFFLLTHPLFSATFEAMLPLVSSAAVLHREFQTKRLYRLSSFFLARTTGELPVVLVFPLIHTAGAWGLMQFHTDGVEQIGKNLDFFGMAVVSLLAGQSFGYFLGSLTQDVEVAISLAIVTLVPLFLLNPFILDASLIPGGIAWVRYLSQFFYGFRAYVTWCWQDMELDACSAHEAAVEFPKECALYHTGADVLRHRFGISDTEEIRGSAFACLFALTLGFRLLAFLRFYLRYEYSDNWRLALGLLQTDDNSSGIFRTRSTSTNAVLAADSSADTPHPRPRRSSISNLVRGFMFKPLA